MVIASLMLYLLRGCWLLIGGVKRIASVSQIVVPFMAVDLCCIRTGTCDLQYYGSAGGVCGDRKGSIFTEVQ